MLANSMWRKELFIVIVGILLGIISAYLPNYAQYAAVAAIVFLLACLFIALNPFYVILLFICWLPLQNFVVLSMGGFLGFSNEIMKGVLVSKEIIAITLLCYLILSRRVKLSSFTYVDYSIFIYLLWITLYLLLPNSMFPVVTKMSARFMGYRAVAVPVVLYFIGRFIPFSEKEMVSSIKLIVFTAFCVGFFGIVERIFLPNSFWIKANISHLQILKGLHPYKALPINFFGIYGGHYIRRAVSTYCDPLSFGFANIFVIPLIIYFVIIDKTKMFKSVSRKLGIVAVVSFSQILTITRASILANLFSFGVFSLYLRKIRRKILQVITLIALAFLLTPLIQTIYHQTVNITDPSSLGHLRALKIGLENIIVYPLGYGFGTGGYVGRIFGTGLAGESLYFSIMVECGIIGIGLFVLSIMFLVIYCSKNKKYLRNNAVLKGLVYIIIASTLGYALASLTTEHWQAFVSSGIYWIYAGIVVQGIYKNKKKNKHRTVV